MVVGSGGFIGRHLVAALDRDGTKVLSVSSQNGTGIDAASGLFRTRLEIPRDVRAVVYLATSPLHRGAPDMAPHLVSVNTVSAIHVAAAAVRSGAQKLLYASTGNVYAPSFAPLRESAPLRRDDWYALSKVHAEEALSLFRDDLDVTVVRLFGIYGPGQRSRLIPNLIHTVCSGGPVVIERNPLDPSDLGGLKISLCYIEDVVKILAALLVRDNSPVINVAGEEALNIRQISTAIGNAMGSAPSFEITTHARGGDLVADISLLKQLLKPKFTPFEIGLRNMLDAVKA